MNLQRDMITGAPAPPRDGLRSISDLYDLFDFGRDSRDARHAGRRGQGAVRV